MQFSGSRALSEAFEIFKSRFGLMLVVGLIFVVLMVAAVFVFGAGMASQLAMGMQSPEAVAGGMGAGMVLFYLIFYLIQFAQQLALTRLCSDRHPPAIGDAITAGFKGAPTMLGAMLLLILVGIVAGLILSVAFAALAAGMQSPALMAVFVAVLLVGVLYLMARLCLLNPIVAIEEQRNPITVIGRTWSLTAGHAGKLMLVYGAVLIAAGALMVAIFMLTIGIPQPGSVPSGGAIAGLVLLVLAYILTFGMFLIALVVAFHRQLAGTSVAAAEAFE